VANEQGLGGCSGSREPSPAVSAASGFDPARFSDLIYAIDGRIGEARLGLKYCPMLKRRAMRDALLDQTAYGVQNALRGINLIYAQLKSPNKGVA
jgi:hypothetical protein